MIFGLGMPELLIILVVTLLVFGPRNLPKLGSMFGQKIHEIRDAVDDDSTPAE
jgi:sec-independent protein translocase protein TatA